MNEFDKKLEAAIKGVTYRSEGDPQPLEGVRLGPMPMEINEENVRALTGETEELEILNYFSFIWPRMTTGDQRKQYEQIDELMQDNLASLVVYRFGSVNVRFYVIGNDISGIAGWKAVAKQT